MVGEKRKKKACAVDGRARAARRTSCLSRLSGVSRVCRHQGSSALIFIIIIESGEGVVVRDAGHLPARKSPLGHGAAADDAARCVGGLTAIRSASTKAAACPAALRPVIEAGRFHVLSLKQCHPPSSRKLYAGRSRCMGPPSGERLGVN